MRQLFENRFVNELEANGAKAGSSFAVMGQVEITEASVKEAVQTHGYDSALVTHMVAVESKTEYDRGELQVGAPQYRNFYGYYPRVQGYVGTPGTYVETEYAVLETNVYELEGATLVWSARTSTFRDENPGKSIADLVTVLVKQLKADGLVGG